MTPKINFLAAIILSTALCAGCAGGPTRDSYRTLSLDQPPKPKEPPVFLSSTNITSDVDMKTASGYVLLGKSDYTGKCPELGEMRKQAKKVRAVVVLFSVKYLRTISGSKPLYLQTPTQTVTSPSYGAPFGPGRPRTYISQTTTVIPGVYYRVNVPYSYPQYEVHEAFLGKL